MQNEECISTIFQNLNISAWALFTVQPNSQDEQMKPVQHPIKFEKCKIFNICKRCNTVRIFHS